MIRFFAEEDQAREHMRLLNQTHCKEIFCLVDGPEDNFAVVDLKTAIEMDMPYEWSRR
jgi:hypothetical protein